MKEPGGEQVRDIVRRLRGTLLEDRLILGGSSGLFGFATSAPAFTEDVDFLIEEELVVAGGADIVAAVEALGYRRHPETPTFSAPDGPTFDLVGYSRTDLTDHLSPDGPLRVMVFGDLGVVLGDPGSVEREPSGILTLSPAGFCAVKLLTVRLEKGAKDKIQALLVVDERASESSFRQVLKRILGRFDFERRRDALADAQLSFLSLQRDPEFRDHGAEGYAQLLERVESGYGRLLSLLEADGHGG